MKRLLSLLLSLCLLAALAACGRKDAKAPEALGLPTLPAAPENGAEQETGGLSLPGLLGGVVAIPNQNHSVKAEQPFVPGPEDYDRITFAIQETPWEYTLDEETGFYVLVYLGFRYLAEGDWTLASRARLGKALGLEELPNDLTELARQGGVLVAYAEAGSGSFWALRLETEIARLSAERSGGGYKVYTSERTSDIFAGSVVPCGEIWCEADAESRTDAIFLLHGMGEFYGLLHISARNTSDLDPILEQFRALVGRFLCEFRVELARGHLVQAVRFDDLFRDLAVVLFRALAQLHSRIRDGQVLVGHDILKGRDLIEMQLTRRGKRSVGRWRLDPAVHDGVIPKLRYPVFKIGIGLVRFQIELALLQELFRHKP